MIIAQAYQGQHLKRPTVGPSCRLPCEEWRGCTPIFRGDSLAAKYALAFNSNGRTESHRYQLGVKPRRPVAIEIQQVLLQDRKWLLVSVTADICSSRHRVPEP